MGDRWGIIPVCTSLIPRGWRLVGRGVACCIYGFTTAKERASGLAPSIFATEKGQDSAGYLIREMDLSLRGG